MLCHNHSLPHQATSELLGQNVNPYLLLTAASSSFLAALTPGDITFSSLKDWFGISGSNITFTAVTPASAVMPAGTSRLISDATYFSDVSALARIAYPLPSTATPPYAPTWLPPLNSSGKSSSPINTPGGTNLSPTLSTIPSVYPPSDSSGDTGTRTGLIVGLVVGVMACLCILIGAILLIAKRVSKKPARKHAQVNNGA